MNNNIRIALVACRSVVGDTSGNLERIKNWTIAASQQGADLVCFPELSITGYHVRKPLTESAESIPGPSSGCLEKIAATHNIPILAGLAEKRKNRIYAAHLLAEPQIGISGVYRKLHLGPPEKKMFSPGSRIPPLFTVRGLVFGIQLCYDAHFPELSTQMAVHGADVLLIPHASPGGSPVEKLASWMRHLPARAYDNGVYVAALNAVGDNGQGLCFPGVAALISPEGKVVQSYTGMDEHMLIGELDAEKLQAIRSHPMKYFLPSRRPELYKA
jgi:predicted amidohydrolase